MKKPKGKGKGQKPNAPKPKNTKQKQKQTQNVNVKINIGQLKKTRASKGSNVIHSYAPQPITSYPLYPLFRDEAPQPPPFRNIDNIPSNTLQNTPKIRTKEGFRKVGPQ